MSVTHLETGMYTVPEAAKRLGLGRRTLYGLIERNQSPVRAVKIGGSWRLPKHLVEAVVAGEAVGQ